MDASAKMNIGERPRKLFSRDDVVEILPEFQDPGDDGYIWIVVGDEEKGRVDITPIDIDSNLKPIYVVRVDQIRRVKLGETP